MTESRSSKLDFTEKTAERARNEDFEFSFEAGGYVLVRNCSYDDPDSHTYRVAVKDGIPIACPCPANRCNKKACKHRVAVALELEK